MTEREVVFVCVCVCELWETECGAAMFGGRGACWEMKSLDWLDPGIGLSVIFPSQHNTECFIAYLFSLFFFFFDSIELNFL